MLAGTSTQRTIVASISSATADAEADLLGLDEVAGGEADEDDDDDQRRAGDHPRRRRHGVLDRTRVVTGLQVPLTDPAEQEDVVIHREPEQDREQEDRHPRGHRRHLTQAEELVADALLEDEHHQAVRGADRDEVEHDRLQRQHDRAEGDGQHHEAQAQHDQEDPRQPVPREGAVVDLLRRLAGDEHLGVDTGEDVRNVVGYASPATASSAPWSLLSPTTSASTSASLGPG